MSKFREARQEAAAAANRRARPSALQIAWLLVLLLLGGLFVWLLLPSADETSPAAQVASIKPPPPGPAMPSATPATPVAGAEPATAAPPAPRPAKAAPSPLTPAPVAALEENGPSGPLPRIAADGREPWKVYAHPYEDKTARPRIAIVVAGLGLSKMMTETAVTTLPPAVSLAFSPYGDALPQRVAAARKAGHEILLMMPMEPQDFPKNDPGPHTLLTSLPDSDNLSRLHWALARFPGYVGIVNEMGSKFTGSEQAMTPVLRELKARGLLFLDARSSQYSVAAKLARNLRVPRAINNRYIDADPSEAQIRKRLEEIENIAKTYGAAAAIGYARPITMTTVAAWAADLEKRGFELVPLSAVVNRQPVR